MRYRVAVVSADQDVLENRALASAEAGTIQSAESRAWVRVRRSWPLETRAVIGKVFVDENRNGRQDSGELGISGVDVWTDDGEITTTDSEGRFSFQNLRPGQHAYHIDAVTLPSAFDAGATPIVMRDGSGWTTPRVNFAVVPAAAGTTAAGTTAAGTTAAGTTAAGTTAAGTTAAGTAAAGTTAAGTTAAGTTAAGTTAAGTTAAGTTAAARRQVPRRQRRCRPPPPPHQPPLYQAPPPLGASSTTWCPAVVATGPSLPISRRTMLGPITSSTSTRSAGACRRSCRAVPIVPCKSSATQTATTCMAGRSGAMNACQWNGRAGSRINCISPP